jgi:CheY-like chemotaxis protein
MSETEASRTILLAEDEETDVILFRLALKRAELPYTLAVTHDGQEAIEYLSGSPPYDDRQAHPLPGLMFLDLKMPRLTGFEVLAWLTEQPRLRQVPALVLSSSSYPDDIQKAAQLGARDYYVKPHTLGELSTILRDAAQRWLAGL